MLMLLFKIFISILVYIAFFVMIIKFYLWSRRLQKRYQSKWGKRFGLFFFFAPMILIVVNLIFTLPPEWHAVLKVAVDVIDKTLSYIKGVLEPVLGTFGYLLIKPIISALVYAFFGFIFGSVFDLLGKKKPEENVDQVEQKK